MRPRPDAAENGATGCAPLLCWPRFNEAAARCRGKLILLHQLAVHKNVRFNEAAARCRGKRGPARQGGRAPRAASMRPRPDAAENTNDSFEIEASAIELQ